MVKKLKRSLAILAAMVLALGVVGTVRSMDIGNNDPWYCNYWQPCLGIQWLFSC
jgi:hypothetical protein